MFDLLCWSEIQFEMFINVVVVVIDGIVITWFIGFIAGIDNVVRFGFVIIFGFCVNKSKRNL